MMRMRRDPGGRTATRYSRRLGRRQAKARVKIDRLQRKKANLKARGRLVKADKVQRKITRVAARTGVSVKAAPGIRRKAPRYKYRIRKGQRQMWSLKYRGWVTVPSRRRRVVPKMAEELKDIKESVDLLRTIIGVIK